MAELATLERAYRMRCYPTVRQRRVLERLFGASRFVWNWALERRSTAYQVDGTRLDWVSLSREFTQLRHAEQTCWLAELPREPFNQVLRDQERAFKNFFPAGPAIHAFANEGLTSACASHSTSVALRWTERSRGAGPMSLCPDWAE